MNPIRSISAGLLRCVTATRAALVCAALAASTIQAQAQQPFSASLWAWEVVPPVASGGIGNCLLTLNTTTRTIYYNIEYVGLTSAETDCHFRGPANSGSTGPIFFHLPLGTPKIGSLVLTPTQMSFLQSGLWYVELETVNFPNGEIRGQVNPTFAPPPIKYCFGDGSGTACPCGNASNAGNQEGCLNSFGTGGKLVGTGLASVGVDGLVLQGTNMTNGAALYFQGTTRANGGAGTVFGDGLRCAAGTIIRLGTKTNSSGASQYPASGDLTVAQKGLVPAGGNVVRTYQAWYRNAAAFCTGDTFNLTNGLEIVWMP